MQEHQFVLSFLLLLSERLPCYGSSTTMAEEASSGDGPLPSTTMATLGLTSSVAFLTTSDQDGQDADTSLAEAEGSEVGSTTTTEPTDMQSAGLHPAVMFGVPAALLSILLVLLVIFIVRRRNQKQSKQDELGSENCKSPIFEEDTPSVMEIEMEELDKWMNSLKRNAECEYLPPVKEEKDCTANLSDSES
nr:transmembrane protein 154 isoform X1 [Pogona vitticeps]XP_020637001.1 transmembrane protein 154 isoform X1 [Pogona vitticeps]